MVDKIVNPDFRARMFNSNDEYFQTRTGFFVIHLETGSFFSHYGDIYQCVTEVKLVSLSMDIDTDVYLQIFDVSGTILFNDSIAIS